MSNVVRMSTLRRAAAAEAARGLDTVGVRHTHVHEHDVGLSQAHLIHGLGAVGGFADDLDVSLAGKHRPQPASDHCLIVGDDDRDHVLSTIGRLTVTTKRPASAPTRSSPP